MQSNTLDPQCLAGIEMVGRTGARDFEISFDDGGEEKRSHPVIWNAVAAFKLSKGTHFFVAAGWTPSEAVFKLLEQLVDGGKCVHCKKPTGVTNEIGTMPLDKLVCWYQYDPELSTYRRGCEGS